MHICNMQVCLGQVLEVTEARVQVQMVCTS